MILRPDGPGQPPHRMIQPGVQFLQEFLLAPVQFRMIRHSAQHGVELSVFIQRDFHILFRIAGRLHDMGAVPAPFRQSDVLVSGQQQVEGQFLA